MLPTLRLAVAIALFVAPGWMLSRRVTGPLTPVASFLGSAAVLFTLVFLLVVIGVPINAVTVGVGLVVVTALLSCKRPQPAATEGRTARAVHDVSWVWWVPAGFGLASIVLRAVIDPLSGFDNSFRWDYLARTLVARGTLAGYPPVTAADFQQYGWCDGIPPLVSFLDFWLYSASGITASSITAVRVAAEAVLTGSVVWSWGRDVWGRGGGWVCLAVLASSSLFLWAVAMGQETGLTALTFIALLYFLREHGNSRDARTAFWAAVAAGTGALCREYGLGFVVFGLGVLVAQRAPRRNLATFFLTGTMIAAPWYIRNWCLTGNPLYPQPLGGLFPSNPVHLEIVETIRKEWNLASAQHRQFFLIKAILATGGSVLLLAAIGIARTGRRCGLLVLGGAFVTSLWAWSVPQTGGGWIYSLRVLSPALAVGAVLSGWIGQTRRSIRVTLLAVLIAVAFDGSRRAWYLPVAPLTPPWPWSFAGWAALHRQVDSVGERSVCSILVRAAAGAGIVVDQPVYHAIVATAGGRAIPLMSPVLNPTFRSGASFVSVVSDLRHENIRFILVDPTSTVMQDFAVAHPFWRELLGRRSPTVRTRFLAVYDLLAMEPR